MRPLSVRARLALWNMTALALLLALLGGAMRVAAVSTVLRSIDAEMLQRTRPHVGPRGGRGRGGPPGDRPGPPGNRFGPPPFSFDENRDPDSESRRGPSRWPGFDRPDGRHGPPDRQNGDPPVFRPRRFDRAGKPLDEPDGAAPWDREAFVLALQGREVFSNVTVAGQPVRLLSRPFPPRGRAEGVIQAPYPLAEVNRAIAGMDRAFLLLLPAALLCAGLGGALLTGTVLRPVRRLTRTAARLGADDLAERLPVAGRDEFSELSRTFNGMLERLQSAFARQQTLVEQQRRFTADASHELKSPLTVIRGNAELLRADPALDSEQREIAEDIHAASGRMARLVQDLLLLARSDAGALGRERTLLLVRDVLERARAAVRRRPAAPVTLDIEPPDLAVCGSEDELVRLFANLLDNALRHTPPMGRVTLTARRDGDAASISVADTGEGIPPEHLPHLGERFYRADAARARTDPDGGTGLGLSIARSVAEAHGGALAFQSAPGVGTTVTTRLPLADK